MDQSVANSLVDRTREVGQAHIVDNRVNRSQTVQRIRIDLSVERRREDPRAIDFPFQSFFIESASSPNAFLYFLPGTKELSQEHFRAGYRDGWGQDYPISQAFMFWPPQVGAWVDVVFFFDSHFRSGSQVNVNAGGVSINDGSSVQTLDPVTVGTSVTPILPQNLLRKVTLLQNDGTSDVFVGDASVSTAKGIRIKPGESFEWRNTAALFGISGSAGQNIRAMNEEG